MYHFIAILYYFGMVRLPAKTDYWDTSLWMPYHWISHEHGMPWDKFKFQWRHFHVSKPDDSDIHKEADEIDNEDEEEDCIEITIERVQHDQEELMMEERDQEEC